MCFLFKTLFRTAVAGTFLAAAVVGGSAMVVGPDRVGAMADQLQAGLEARFDQNIDDPVALRRQIGIVQRQYPERIRSVRADLTSLQEEMVRLEREQAVSGRVVALVDEDLSRLEPALAEVASARVAGEPRAQRVAIQFDGEVMSLSRANSKVKEIRRTRAAHASRAADASHNLKYLRNQESRFQALLDQLEEENAQLQTQIVQLENEVESIARNQRLISELEARQRTLDEAGRFDSVSFEHITGALERKRTEQEAELDRLAAGVEAIDYVEVAASQLRAESPKEAAEVLTEQTR